MEETCTVHNAEHMDDNFRRETEEMIAANRDLFKVRQIIEVKILSKKVIAQEYSFFLLQHCSHKPKPRENIAGCTTPI